MNAKIANPVGEAISECRYMINMKIQAHDLL